MAPCRSTAVDMKAAIRGGASLLSSPPACKLTQVLPAEDVPSCKIKRYEIAQLLGTGASGDVWSAVQLDLERRVAVKVLKEGRAHDPRCRRRFVSEARLLARINHPNVVAVYDIGETEDGRPFFAMELLEGCSLRTMLEGGPLPYDRVLRLTIDACRGVSAAHRAGAVHRDLKPENLFVTDPHGEERCKVLDFSVAKDVLSTTMTTNGALIGTIGYMAPEQALGLPSDARSDVYALALIFYEAVTGELYYTGQGYEKLCANASGRADLGRLSELVPPPVGEATRRALAPNPEERFSSPDLFADALLGSTEPGKAPPCEPERIPSTERIAGATDVTLEMNSDTPRRSGEASQPLRQVVPLWSGIALLVGAALLVSWFARTTTGSVVTNAPLTNEVALRSTVPSPAPPPVPGPEPLPLGSETAILPVSPATLRVAGSAKTKESASAKATASLSRRALIQSPSPKSGTSSTLKAPQPKGRLDLIRKNPYPDPRSPSPSD